MIDISPRALSELAKGDSLFALPQGKSQARNLRLNNHYYLFGYLQAANLLVSCISEGRADPDKTILQATYLYRHHIELFIKAIIHEAQTMAPRSRKARKRATGHDLILLTETLANVIPSLAGSREYRHFKRLVREVGRIDPRGESLRYALRKDMAPTIKADLLVDPGNLAMCFNKMSFFLERVYETLLWETIKG